MRDYSVTQMFMCFRRCSCVEPSDPTNGTLKYWETNNITASEIYWEALEVKVLLLKVSKKKKKKETKAKSESVIHRDFKCTHQQELLSYAKYIV